METIEKFSRFAMNLVFYFFLIVHSLSMLHYYYYYYLQEGNETGKEWECMGKGRAKEMCDNRELRESQLAYEDEVCLNKYTTPYLNTEY